MAIGKTSGEFKDMALATLKGKWDIGVVATLIFYSVILAAPIVTELIIGGSSNNANLNLIVQLALIPLEWGFTVLFLRMVRGATPGYKCVFEGFNRWWWVFKAYIYRNISILLWTLLLIVPGIIKSYSYSMMPYILEDNPGITASKATEESERLMEGNKMRLFLLDLSFIGWALLSCLTFGIGFLFLLPYFYTARAHFYAELKANDQNTWTVNAYGNNDITNEQQTL